MSCNDIQGAKIVHSWWKYEKTPNFGEIYRDYLENME